MSAYTRYYKYISDIMPSITYDFKEKERNTNQHIFYMLNRTSQMFKWHNLPDSIPQRILELFLQINGNVCFYEYNGELYIFCGGLGGEPDVYYRPTIYTIANPYLKISKNLKIDDDCIVMYNDTMLYGLLPLFSRYATAISETELSIQTANINTRIIDLITAPDDRTKKAAEKYLEDIEKGELGVIAENSFLDGLKTQPYGNTGTNNLTNLIELEQYLKASWFNEIGLNANYNMKRESINSGESQLNNDALLPLVDDMLYCRQEAIDKINEKYNLNISVELNSSWEDNIQEIDAEHGELTEEAQTEQTETTEEITEEKEETKDEKIE